MYNLDDICERVRRYKLEQILNSGENDMFDDKIDKKKIEEILNEDVSSKVEIVVNLKKTVEDIDNSKLYESIINLKNKKEYVE